MSKEAKRKSAALSRHYTTKEAATQAMHRFLKRYPDCKVEVVSNTEWLRRFQWMVRLHGRDLEEALAQVEGKAHSHD